MKLLWIDSDKEKNKYLLNYIQSNTSTELIVKESLKEALDYLDGNESLSNSPSFGIITMRDLKDGNDAYVDIVKKVKHQLDWKTPILVYTSKPIAPRFTVFGEARATYDASEIFKFVSDTPEMKAKTPRRSRRAVAQPKKKREEKKGGEDEVVWFEINYPDLSGSQIRKMLQQFKEHDKDGSGGLDKAEFEKLLEQNLTGISPVLIKRLVDLQFEEADKDKSGHIDKVEFFDAYDSIFADERCQVALLLAPDLPGWSLPKIVEQLEELEESLDLDGNGVIDRSEFFQLRDKLAGPKLSQLLKDQVGSKKKAALSDLLSSMAAPKTESKKDINDIFEAFAEAENLPDILKEFEALKKACGITKGDNVFSKIKENCYNQGLPFKRRKLWDLLEVKNKKSDYENQPLKGKKVLLVGSGPAGLRAAVEFACLGGSVTIIEKRDDFTRNNELHLWESSLHDIVTLGVKAVLPSSVKLGTGSVLHVGIRRLQILLAKICLVLGVNLYPGTTYTKAKNGTVTVETKATIPPEHLKYDILIGGDAGGSIVGSQFGFQEKETKGKPAIGITANFVNSQTPEERNVEEISGVISWAKPQLFRDLKAKYKIDLENLVFYRGETHYFVMTPKKASLLERGALKKDGPYESILERSNIDKPKLEAFARDVATFVGLPTSCKFVPTHHGADVAIFDFSRKRQATPPLKVDNGRVVALLGDALVEPFWPQGTGANRAFLSALDCAWFVKRHVEGEEQSKVISKADKAFAVMSTSGSSDIKPAKNHGLDPQSRYKKKTSFA